MSATAGVPRGHGTPENKPGKDADQEPRGGTMRLRTARIRAATMLVAALPALFLALPARAADHLKVGTSHISGYAGVPVALARGYFAAQDIEVEMVFFDSSQPISVGVASGDIDLGVSGSSA